MREGALLQVRADEQISARLVWDGQAGRGRRAPRAAAVTTRLTAVRRNLSWWT